jgi:undecaprenyl diphosphate synthase
VPKQASPLFSPEQLSAIDFSKIPQHVAIIPDGNRRWAKQQGLTSLTGHRHGSKIIQPIVQAAKCLGIKALTLYTFSTENWQRSGREVTGLMLLLRKFLVEQAPPMKKEGVKLHTIGDTTKLPKKVLAALKDAQEMTKQCSDINLILALNYGGRDEICRMVKEISTACVSKKLSPESIDETLIESYLDTHEWPEPELLIRTSHELRLSNFLLWQIAYTEIHFSPVLWPDFSPTHFLDAIVDYQRRSSRRGA